MQYLKEDVKTRILTSALKAFKKEGYMDASVRNIAKDAGVALGNVYRYFKNKEDLFNAIVDPVYDRLMKYIDNLKKVDKANSDAVDELMLIKDKIIEVFKENSSELLILLDKSKGSKYENMKEGLVLYVDGMLKERLIPEIRGKGLTVKNEFITYVLASTLLEGVSIILRNNNDGIMISYLISQLINIYFIDIDKRWE